MTFEEEKLQEAMQVLKDMEKRCAQDMGWIKTVKNKVFGATNGVSVFFCLILIYWLSYKCKLHFSLFS